MPAPLVPYQQQWRFLFLGAAVVNVTGAEAATPNGIPPSIRERAGRPGVCPRNRPRFDGEFAPGERRVSQRDHSEPAGPLLLT